MEGVISLFSLDGKLQTFLSIVFNYPKKHKNPYDYKIAKCHNYLLMTTKDLNRTYVQLKMNKINQLKFWKNFVLLADLTYKAQPKSAK